MNAAASGERVETLSDLIVKEPGPGDGCDGGSVLSTGSSLGGA